MTIFAIPGQPFAKQRHRHSRGRTYTPKQTVAHEARVAQIAAQHFPKPIDGPVKVQIWASFAPPKSWSQKKANHMLGQYHTQRPDSDNIEKAIKDGMNGIAYADDCQVAWTETRKVWGVTAQTVVIVTPIGPWLPGNENGPELIGGEA